MFTPSHIPSFKRLSRLAPQQTARATPVASSPARFRADFCVVKYARGGTNGCVVFSQKVYIKEVTK